MNNILYTLLVIYLFIAEVPSKPIGFSFGTSLNANDNIKIERNVNLDLGLSGGAHSKNKGHGHHKIGGSGEIGGSIGSSSEIGGAIGGGGEIGGSFKGEGNLNGKHEGGGLEAKYTRTDLIGGPGEAPYIEVIHKTAKLLTDGNGKAKGSGEAGFAIGSGVGYEAGAQAGGKHSGESLIGASGGAGLKIDDEHKSKLENQAGGGLDAKYTHTFQIGGPGEAPHTEVIYKTLTAKRLTDDNGKAKGSGEVGFAIGSGVGYDAGAHVGGKHSSESLIGASGGTGLKIDDDHKNKIEKQAGGGLDAKYTHTFEIGGPGEAPHIETIYKTAELLTDDNGKTKGSGKLGVSVDGGVGHETGAHAGGKHSGEINVGGKGKLDIRGGSSAEAHGKLKGSSEVGGGFKVGGGVSGFNLEISRGLSSG